MYGYIYKTTDLSNGKIYIGQHKATKFSGASYVGSGIIIRAIKDFCHRSGIAIVDRLRTDIIEECNSAEELNDREIYWIKYFDSMNPQIGYNLYEGGLNTTDSRNRMYGRHHTEESKQKNRNSHLNRVWVTNGKVDYLIKNEFLYVYLSNGFYCGRANVNYQKERSAETGRHISMALKGKKKSKQHRKSISDNRRGRKYLTNGVGTRSVRDEATISELLSQGYWFGRTFGVHCKKKQFY